jgi:hypothetical protein
MNASERDLCYAKARQGVDVAMLNTARVRAHLPHNMTPTQKEEWDELAALWDVLESVYKRLSIIQTQTDPQEEDNEA